MGIKIDNHIKYNLSFHNFKSYEILSLFKDDNIKMIEDFAKETLADIISQEECCNYYGVFKNKTEKFSFLGGDIIKINAIVNYCKNRNDSVIFNKKQEKQNTENISENILKNKKQISSSGSSVVKRAHNLENENKALKKHVTRTYKYIFQDISLDEKIVKKINELSIESKIDCTDENLNIYCTLPCGFCTEKIKVR